MHRRRPAFSRLTICSIATACLYSQAAFSMDFNGVQLAWVKLPATPAADDSADAKAKKPQKAAPASAPANKPATAAPAPVAPLPITAPAKPAIQQVTPPAEIKVAPAPQPKPVVTPKPVVPAAAVVLPPITTAKDQPAKPANTGGTEWLFGIGLEAGRESLGDVVYSDGSSATVFANSGWVVRMGGTFQNGADSDFYTQATVGYKSGGPKLWNQDVNWSAVPLELIEQYRMSSMRLGIGINYQLNTQFKVNLPATSFVTKFDNALGYVLQLAWMPPRESYGIDFKFTSIRFKQSDLPDPPLLNGNVVGLSWNYRY